MGTARFLTALLASAVFAASAHAQPKRSAWMENLPADTWLFVGHDGGPAFGPQLQQTPVGKVLSEPQGKRYFTTVVQPALERLRAIGTEQMGPELSGHMQTLFTVLAAEKTSVVLLGVDFDGKGPPTPQALIVVTPGARRDAFKITSAALEALLLVEVSQLKDRQGKPLKAEERKIGAHSVRTLRCPVGSAEMVVNWGWVGDELLVTVGQRAEKIFFGGEVPAAPLYRDADFLAAGKAAHADSPNAVFRLYANVGAVRKQFAGMLPPEVAKVLAATGLDGFNAIAETVRIEEGEFRTSTAVKVDAIRGLYRISQGKAFDEASYKLIPRDTRLLAAVPFEAGALYDTGLDAAAAVLPPRELETLKREIARVDDSLGLSLRKDILGTFGGRILVMAWPHDALPLVGGVTALVEVKDKAAAAAVLDKLRTGLTRLLEREGRVRAGPGVEIPIKLSQREFRGRTIDTVNLGIVAPAWTLLDGYLVVGWTPQAVMDYLVFLDDKSAPTILDNPDFVARRKAVGDGSILVYGDLTVWWPHIHSAILMGLYSAEFGLKMEAKEVGIDLHPELFPSVGAVQKHMRGIMAGGGWNGTTFTFHTASPVPLPPPTMLKGLVLPALILPAVVQVRHQARNAQAMNNLRQIGVASHNFAVEKDGRFPKDVKELAKYVDDLEALVVSPDGGRLEYFGAGKKVSDSANPARDPLAAYPTGSDGMRVVLFADGSVRRMYDFELRRQLRGEDVKSEKFEFKKEGVRKEEFKKD